MKKAVGQLLLVCGEDGFFALLIRLRGQAGEENRNADLMLTEG